MADSLAADLKIGDCIMVKPGVKDPDLGGDIGGWQGRVTEIQPYQPGQVIIYFQWDSLSLKRMPASAIRRCEEKGLDWTTLSLYPEEVERAEPRDTQADVDTLIGELSEEHAWDYLGKQVYTDRRLCRLVCQSLREEYAQVCREMTAHRVVPLGY